MIGSPDTAACWRLAQTLGCPLLLGNHERSVAHFGRPDAPAEWLTERFAPVRWAVDQLTEAERAAIGALPLALRMSDLPDLLVVHASLRSDNDSIMAYTPDEQLAEMFPNTHERWIVRAHNHIGQVRLWGERTIVTTGAVGLPLDGSATVQYLLLEQRAGGWQIFHQSVAYDLDAALRRFRETGYLDAAGPMAQLFMRQVATASHQIVPFLRAYARWSAHEPLPLDMALDRFLRWA